MQEQEEPSSPLEVVMMGLLMHRLASCDADLKFLESQIAAEMGDPPPYSEVGSSSSGDRAHNSQDVCISTLHARNAAAVHHPAGDHRDKECSKGDQDGEEERRQRCADAIVKDFHGGSLPPELECAASSLDIGSLLLLGKLSALEEEDDGLLSKVYPELVPPGEVHRAARAPQLRSVC